jgi:ADP-heptose:LPS heptosyltransferase
MKIAWFITGQLGDTCMHYKVLRQIRSDIQITIFTNAANIALLKALSLNFEAKEYDFNVMQALKSGKVLTACEKILKFLVCWRKFDFAVEPYFWRASARIEASILSKRLLKIKNFNKKQVYSQSIQDIIPIEWREAVVRSPHDMEKAQRHTVIVHPFSSERNRYLTSDQIVEILERHSSSNTYLVGAKREYDELDENIKRLCHSLGVKLFLDKNFQELIFLIKRSSLVIGGESFVVNLADALDRPCIGIYSNLTFPKVWTLSGNQSVVLRNEFLSCGPCFGKIKHCDYYCVKSINMKNIL